MFSNRCFYIKKNYSSQWKKLCSSSEFVFATGVFYTSWFVNFVYIFYLSFTQHVLHKAIIEKFKHSNHDKTEKFNFVLRSSVFVISTVEVMCFILQNITDEL